ncbi:MAG: cadherin repeat domain-containing protein [Planctomycetes bacterium]|nr:cadherin repeat domain-containing protein [Planctomycetota bacterium]
MLSVISVGDFFVMEGTPFIDIPVMISGGENIANATVGFSVGDGGPILSGTETVTITAVDHTNGTVWGGQAITIIPPGPALPAASATIVGAVLATSGANVAANGLLMTFTLDLTTASVGEVLLLDPNVLNFTGAIAVDPTPGPDPQIFLSLTFDPGSLTITGGILNDPPTITSLANVSVAENQTAVIDVQSSDPDGETEGSGLSYSLTGGADQSLFSIVAGTGILTFNSPPDFENPTDAGGNNVYDVQVPAPTPAD